MSAISQCEVPLPRRIDAPRRARMLLTKRLGTQLVGHELDTAKLLTTELVTNAVLHGLGAISLRIDLDESRVLVEVTDEGTGFARATREQTLSEPGGWGLRLVASESSRWGIRDGSSHVWFELDRCRLQLRQ